MSVLFRVQLMIRADKFQIQAVVILFTNLWPHSYVFRYWSRYKMATIFQTYFEMHFPEWKCIYFGQGFPEVSS